MGLSATGRFTLDSTVAGAQEALTQACLDAVTITNASATSIFDVLIASGSMIGGGFVYQVHVSDGTDYQSLSGLVTYSAVNKAGTITGTITEATGNQAKTVSAGTLTLAWTIVAGTNKVTIKLQPTTSLTATTPFNVRVSLLPISGLVTAV
jgi:hypothetical protein